MATREYLNFVPVTDLIHGDDCDTLLVSLPDFSKEQLNVQLSPGSLKISGERPIEGNKWSRFSKEFPVSSNCDTTKLTANFRLGILYVQQPKLIISAQKKEKLENKPLGSNNEPPKYQKPKEGQEKLENKPSGSNEPPKSQKPKDGPEKLENKPSGSNEPPKSQKPQKPKDGPEKLENKPSGSNEPPKSQKPKDGQEKLENKPSGSHEPPKSQNPKDDQEKLENKPSGSNEPLKSRKPKNDQEKLENKSSGSNEPLKSQPQNKNQETTRLHKDGQSHKTNQGMTTKPKDDQLTQLQKGAQEADQITNPMGKQKDQKLGNVFGDSPKKETVANEVPEKSSSKEDKIKEIVGDKKNERKYEEDEYEQAINRAMMVGQPSRWMSLVLVVLFIFFVWFHLMSGTIEGSEN